MNYDPIAQKVLTALKKMGVPCKVVGLTGTLTSTFGVWGKIENKDVLASASALVTMSERELYVPYIKVAPEVGGHVIFNKLKYTIREVVTYQPNNKALGFKLKVIS